METLVSTAIVINHRARSAEQKALRRHVVIEAAETYFGEVGYEAFSMAQLAKRSGVAKGTIYLYFKTREDLFLSLYEQSLTRWSHIFIGYLSESISSEVYAETLYDTALADGTLLPLLIRLEHIIEHNVEIHSLIRSKRVFIGEVERIAEPTSTSLKLSQAQAIEIVKTLGVLLITATRVDQGPALDNEELPIDVQELIASFSSKPFFVKNAIRIIECIRTEATSNA
jgi:TetR/AcrR family transcriptional regulator